MLLKKNKYFIVAVVFFVIIIFCGVLFFVKKNDYSEYGNRKGWILFGNSLFRIEIADSNKKRQLGLGKRKDMCEKCGMLFIFDDKQKRSFWMKDMEFPLDIIWIDGEKVVAMEENIPFDFSETIKPSVAADKVLELNAGTVKEFGVKIDDKIFFSIK
ncbi:MAG: hypothetical protein ACD_11C00103G0059 [uncultured bacterium]|nr:MAG: hypothetical protein ACD_11C00103G0059 [uncultured bacterium]HBR71203.1 hypothetical protein [Candidatus Moranbacteria bacterium]